MGDGARKKLLEEECRDIKSVDFFDPVPFPELSSLLLSTDAHFLFQKNDVVDTVMPSKILPPIEIDKSGQAYCLLLNVLILF